MKTSLNPMILTGLRRLCTFPQNRKNYRKQKLTFLSD